MIVRITNKNQFIEIPLYFNHPCKTMIWRGQRTNYTFDDSGDFNYNKKYFLGNLYDYSTIGGNTQDENAVYSLNPDVVKTVKLQLNGLDRLKERDGTYFRTVQPNQFITSSNSGLALYQNNLKRFGGGFYMYNFGLRVDEHQPSGTCNFSRVDNAVLHMNINPYSSANNSCNKCYDYNFRVFAVNYNVLRVMSGMGGLAYSN